MKSSALIKKMFFSVVKIFAGFSSRTCHILQVYVFKQHRRSSVHKHTKIKIIDIRKRGWMETQPKGKYKPFALAKKTNKRWMQIQQRNIRIEKKKKTCAEPQSRKQLTEKHKTANMESILRINGIYVFCLRFSRVCLMDILLSTEIITLFRIYFTSSSKRIKTKPSIFEYRFEYITVVCVWIETAFLLNSFFFCLFARIFCSFSLFLHRLCVCAQTVIIYAFRKPTTKLFFNYCNERLHSTNWSEKKKHLFIIILWIRKLKVKIRMGFVIRTRAFG